MPTIITRAAGSLKSMGFAGSSSSSAAFLLAKSLRTRNAANASTSYLSRTPGSASNQSTWTFSAWVKRASNLNYYQYILTAGSGAPYVTLGFNNNNKLQFILDAGSSSTGLLTTSVYADTTAWYHIVANIDTTQATAANRISLYVNGVQPTAYDIATYPGQNSTWKVNAAGYHGISGSQYIESFDGYITDVYFVDGQQLSASSFGSTNATTGQWLPKAYTGTYGTNGYHLTFSNTTSTTTLGYDTSGNSNHWTTTNISLTAGLTYDSMTDVPTLTSGTTGNYAVLNPMGIIPTLSNGNLSYTSPAAAPAPAYSSIGMTTGKWYAELTTTTANFEFGVWGNGTASMPNSYPLYYWDFGWSTTGALSTEKTSGTLSGSGGTSAVGNVYAIAVDLDNTTVYFYQNNTLIYTITGMIFTGPLFFTVASWTSSASSQSSINFGQQGFKYTPPSGYVALNTYNLPTPAIAQGNKYMDVTLFAGAGANQSVINAGAFQPDVVWIKNRTNSSNHQLVDSVRGVSLSLFPNLVDGEGTSSNMTSSFNSNGFSIAGNSNNLNASGSNYVAWQWQAAVGNNVTNTAGSVNSTVSANTTAGFSIVTYTGPGGSNGTIGHGLGSIPSMIWTKVRSGINADWAVYHSAVGNTSALFLDTTAAATSGVGYWNNTSPTANVFSVGNSANTNYSATITYVAYCWAPVAGYSAFGSYVGNGTANTGPFVYTGFRPKLIMIKSTAGTTGDWMVWDTARDPINQAHRALLWDSANAEVSNDPYSNFSIFSNGFRLEESVSSPGYGNNISGYTYIYAAFAENPFKYSLAR